MKERDILGGAEDTLTLLHIFSLQGVKTLPTAQDLRPYVEIGGRR